MQVVRVWVRGSRLGVCKVSTGVRHNWGNAGVGQSVTVRTETECCPGGKEVTYLHSFTVYCARAVDNQEPTPTEYG